jgi:hypothetical protein
MRWTRRIVGLPPGVAVIGTDGGYARTLVLSHCGATGIVDASPMLVEWPGAHAPVIEKPRVARSWWSRLIGGRHV